MTTDAQFPNFRKALARHVAGIRGLVGVDAFLREDAGGPWLGAARLGQVDPERVEPTLLAFDPAAGGRVEAMGGKAAERAGWAASYMLGGPGLDLVLLIYLQGLAPNELQTQLALVEAKVGWLMLAALSDRKAELGGVALGTGIGAQLLVDAARARSRRLLADQWIARLEKALEADLIAVCWVAGGAASLAALSGGGLVERMSDARSQIEALADFGLRARAPQILTPATDPDEGAVLAETGGDASRQTAAQIQAQEAQSRIEELGAARALVLPVYEGDEAAAVIVAFWTAQAPKGPLPFEAANLVSQVLGETLEIQSRAFPSIWRRLRNWGWAVIVAVFGRSLWKLKLAVTVVVLGCLVLAQIPTRFEPSFGARIEARDRRIVSAPFDGFLAEAPFQLGDLIAPGTLIVALEDSDLVLQIARARSSLSEIDSGIQTARAQRNSAEVQSLEAQRQQIVAELDLLARQQSLARFEAQSPMVVVGGDAWRRVGGRVRLGEPLLELAEPGSFRVLAFIDEDWVADLAPGSTGEVLLSAYPTRPLPVELVSITSDPQMRDGVNTFPAWMDFAAAPDLVLLDRMRGVVRIDGGDTSMLAAYTRGSIRWLRRTLWRWS